MNFIRNKKQVVMNRANSIHESVFKMGDLYKVRTTVDVTKSIINAFVSKAKKEHGSDPRENWSDTELAEMFVSYITTNFLNIESLPVNAILGESTKTPGEMQTEITPEENDEDEIIDGDVVNIEQTSTEPLTVSDENTPSGEIEF